MSFFFNVMNFFPLIYMPWLYTHMWYSRRFYCRTNERRISTKRHVYCCFANLTSRILLFLIKQKLFLSMFDRAEVEKNNSTLNHEMSVIKDYELMSKIGRKKKLCLKNMKEIDWVEKEFVIFVKRAFYDIKKFKKNSLIEYTI